MLDSWCTPMHTSVSASLRCVHGALSSDRWHDKLDFTHDPLQLLGEQRHMPGCSQSWRRGWLVLTQQHHIIADLGRLPAAHTQALQQAPPLDLFMRLEPLLHSQ